MNSNDTLSYASMRIRKKWLMSIPNKNPLNIWDHCIVERSPSVYDAFHISFNSLIPNWFLVCDRQRCFDGAVLCQQVGHTNNISNCYQNITSFVLFQKHVDRSIQKIESKPDYITTEGIYRVPGK